MDHGDGRRAAVRIPGDGGHPISYVRSYDITAATGDPGTRYAFLRITGSADFKLDAVGIVPGHGGPENSSLATAFPTVVLASRSTVPANQVAGGVGVPNGVFTQLNGRYITLGSNGLDLPALIRVNRVAAIPFTQTRDVRVSYPNGNDSLSIDATLNSGIGGTLDTVSQAFDRIDTAAGPTNGTIEFHDGTLTERKTIGANATTVALSSAPADPSLIIVIAEQVLVRNTDFTADGTTNTVTLTGSITEPMVVRVSYAIVGGGTRTQNFSLVAGDSSTLQLRNDLASGGAVTVTTYKVVTGFTVTGATLTVAASSAARTLVVNRPAEQRTYFGGERAFTVVEDSEGRLVLTPDFQRAGADIYNPSTHAAVVDPFGFQLEYKTTDALVHFAGDPALHTAGEVQRYLGGEPIVDELGRPVLNADGTYWTARAGQAVIHNRRDLAFAPDYLSFTYDPSDLTLNLYGDASSSLSAAIDAVATSLSVAAPTGSWTIGSSFLVRIGSELLLVTAASANATTLTVVQRGADGTTATAHDTGSSVSTAPLHYQPNADVSGWALNFDRSATVARPYDAPDRVVAVIVRSDKGIFALYEGHGFTFNRTTGVLTLGAIDPSRIAGTVELTVTLALQLMHPGGEGDDRALVRRRGGRGRRPGRAAAGRRLHPRAGRGRRDRPHVHRRPGRAAHRPDRRSTGSTAAATRSSRSAARRSSTSSRASGSSAQRSRERPCCSSATRPRSTSAASASTTRRPTRSRTRATSTASR